MREPDREPAIDRLCENIVARHHTFVRRALPIIAEDLAASADGDGTTGPQAETRAVVLDLVHQLLGHLSKEENLLFPALVALAQAEREGRSRPPLPFPTVLHPIRMMETEHERIETAMSRLRSLTRDFTAADDSPPAWRHCLAELSQLDVDLREHHRIENENLFPRALDLERRLL